MRQRPPLGQGGTAGGSDTMSRVCNRSSEKTKRQFLRRETPKAEQVFWSKLGRRQMLGYKFRRQYSIAAHVVDFYCPAVRMTIELDGDSHFQKGSPARDEARQAIIESFGIHFLRFRNVEIF